MIEELEIAVECEGYKLGGCGIPGYGCMADRKWALCRRWRESDTEEQGRGQGRTGMKEASEIWKRLLA